MGQGVIEIVGYEGRAAIREQTVFGTSVKMASGDVFAYNSYKITISPQRRDRKDRKPNTRAKTQRHGGRVNIEWEVSIPTTLPGVVNVAEWGTFLKNHIGGTEVATGGTHILYAASSGQGALAPCTIYFENSAFHGDVLTGATIDGWAYEWTVNGDLVQTYRGKARAYSKSGYGTIAAGGATSATQTIASVTRYGNAQDNQAIRNWDIGALVEVVGIDTDLRVISKPTATTVEFDSSITTTGAEVVRPSWIAGAIAATVEAAEDVGKLDFGGFLDVEFKSANLSSSNGVVHRESPGNALANDFRLATREIEVSLQLYANRDDMQLILGAQEYGQSGLNGMTSVMQMGGATSYLETIIGAGTEYDFEGVDIPAGDSNDDATATLKAHVMASSFTLQDDITVSTR